MTAPADGVRDGVVQSILDTIGRTPLVALDRITRGLDGQILAKLEIFNPGLSKKDRAALRIIEEAEQDGSLKPGQTVVELTSGNMGTGLAIVCAVKGYPFVAVMSRGNSRERAVMMAAHGAEVVLVDQQPGSVPGEVSGADLALVEAAARDLCADREAFRVDQFFRPGGVNAHYYGTAAEAWAQSNGRIDAFCDFVGSGGTFAGITRFLKERDQNIGCYLIEPDVAAVMADPTAVVRGHSIQGGGYAMADLHYLAGVEPDGYLKVSSTAAKSRARELASVEGIFAGFSSGANVDAAVQLLEGPLKGKTILVLMCDSGAKYLSTDLWGA